jgi:hypothetical protein
MSVQQQRLKNLSKKHNLELSTNDRLFYRKYLYRVTYIVNSHSIGTGKSWRKPWRKQQSGLGHPDFGDWQTIGNVADHVVNVMGPFVRAIRKTAKKRGDRVRLEANVVNYYTSSMEQIEKICGAKKVWEGIHLYGLAYSLGFEADVRYRTNMLPYDNKYKFQIWCKYGTRDQVKKIVENYSVDNIKIACNNKYAEPSFYVNTEEMVQLLRVALGPKFARAVEYKLLPKEQSN